MNPSVVKTLAVLEFLVCQKQGVTLTEISRALHLPASTTHELVNTLVQLDYVQRDSDSNRYQIGLKLLEFGLSYLREMEIYAAATPLLGEVSRALEGVASVNIFSRSDGLVLELAEEGGAPHIRIVWKVGRQSTLHCGAASKVFMASLTEEEVERILARVGMARFTPRTNTDPEKLREELVQTRDRGYALDREEVHLGISSVAVPIVVDDAPIGALSIRGSADQYDPDYIAGAVELLTTTAAAIATGVIRLSSPSARFIPPGAPALHTRRRLKQQANA